MIYSIQENRDKTWNLMKHGKIVPWRDGMPSNAELEFWLELQAERGRRGMRERDDILAAYKREQIHDGTTPSQSDVRSEWKLIAGRDWEAIASEDSPYSCSGWFNCGVSISVGTFVLLCCSDAPKGQSERYLLIPALIHRQSFINDHFHHAWYSHGRFSPKFHARRTGRMCEIFTGEELG